MTSAILLDLIPKPDKGWQIRFCLTDTETGAAPVKTEPYILWAEPHARARRLVLRYDEARGIFRLTIPYNMSERLLKKRLPDFLAEPTIAIFIRRCLREAAVPLKVEAGAVFFWDGAPYWLDFTGEKTRGVTRRNLDNVSADHPLWQREPQKLWGSRIEKEDLAPFPVLYQGFAKKEQAAKKTEASGAFCEPVACDFGGEPLYRDIEKYSRAAQESLRAKKTAWAGVVEIGGPIDLAPKRFERFFRAEAKSCFDRLSQRYADQLGVQYHRLAVGDMRSRWGSCSHSGGLKYNFRLLMAPPSVQAYVAAHEVAHLKEMNHSPQFWRWVSQLIPGWKTERAWLMRHGRDLHRMRF